MFHERFFTTNIFQKKTFSGIYYNKCLSERDFQWDKLSLKALYQKHANLV